ncbi:hypothetical protein ACWC9T_36700 [Kitasatospora sp. NPDC001159]
MVVANQYQRPRHGEDTAAPSVTASPGGLSPPSDLNPPPSPTTAASTHRRCPPATATENIGLPATA